ncbi:MAG: hypothetical protein PUE12_18250 [Oscillospiraceae bacterium]|nr:hypothetical protein [Oscillospiraceae bacterium]
MPYINTIDINGTTYHLKNLTDGDYVVDLPELNKNDIFVLRGDVVDNLSSYQSNKPLSANQGRALDGKIDNFKSQLDTKDSELDNKISQLRTDMGANDASTLDTSKTYTNESCQAINETVTSLQGTVNDNKKSLDKDIAELTTLVGTKSSETLTAANKYTDDSCATINNTIANLKKTVQDNKSSADSGTSDLRTYVDTTFVEKTKIVDNLTTDSNEQVLSAKQGKALDEKKFNNIGGTISGDVIINGTLSMSETKGINVIKVPESDSDVVNKKYVDELDAELSSRIDDIDAFVDSATNDISTIKQDQNDQSTTLTNLQNELASVKAETKYEVKSIISNFDGTAATCSFQLAEECMVWICITPSHPTVNSANYLNYNQMIYTPTVTASDFYYSLSGTMNTGNIDVELELTHDSEINSLVLNVSITSNTGEEDRFNVCVVSHPCNKT